MHRGKVDAVVLKNLQILQRKEVADDCFTLFGKWLVITMESNIHLKKGVKPMATPPKKMRIQYPAIDILLGLKEGVVWGTPGFRIQLIIDENGYLTDEPRYLQNGIAVPVTGPHCPKPPSLIGYRVRLKTKVDDPPDNSGDPKGCRLSGGVWYC
jgi:hypothetical protein